MSVNETAEKIKSMEIRGAGKIARSAAFALKDYALNLQENDMQKFISSLKSTKEILLNTRPTAVSLENALELVMAGAQGNTVDEVRAGIITAADRFINNSIEAIEKIAGICATRINDGYTIITHCNSSVAVLGIIKAHEQGKKFQVYATETRPWLQGHITSQALADAGVDITLIVDSAVRFFMAEADLVIVGADTVMANGSVVNKIGTSQIALCAHERKVPVLICAESYKFSRPIITNENIRIEERDTSEVVEPGKLTGVKIRNPVFDITPPQYINSIITEFGIISPSNAGDIIQKMFD
jgi:ribose 1,5-bisphosphate isomerase